MQDMHSHCNNYYYDYLKHACSWTITELCVNNTQHMEDEYLRMRREGEHDPITVRFNDQVKEIYVSFQAVINLLAFLLHPICVVNTPLLLLSLCEIV